MTDEDEALVGLLVEKVVECWQVDDLGARLVYGPEVEERRVVPEERLA